MVPGSNTMSEDAQGHFDLKSMIFSLSCHVSRTRRTFLVHKRALSKKIDEKDGETYYGLTPISKGLAEEHHHLLLCTHVLNGAEGARPKGGAEWRPRLRDCQQMSCLGARHRPQRRVGGNMFESVPSADALFIKSTLLNFSDEDCLKMLANCNKALPRGGKMIVVDLMYSKDGAGPTPTVARPGDLKNTRCCLKKVALATFPS
ncbi:hypothetical protein SELMODRAFT_412283 [Selaginella moellendorffii]|uniref:O-methyltransferase C-terminal domain-containing protein n=1 Tax=Selaginella moellendorffii TaxID=88036 RepID=D8RKM9_SELML|nr:hypothetical protein SELMODRAFT_412283 [Selaginella moellendorffii]